VIDNIATDDVKTRFAGLLGYPSTSAAAAMAITR
jgi:hypothetical protein